MYVCFKYKKLDLFLQQELLWSRKPKSSVPMIRNFTPALREKLYNSPHTLVDFNILDVSVDSNWFAQREMFAFVER